MSGFTKGPWIAKEENGTFDIESDDLCIGVVIGFDPDHTGFNICNECQANANLIEAAPDMYELLSEALAMIERQPDFNDDGDGLLTERCKQALAKARGEL